MRLTTRIKHRVLRLLGIVSPSGALPIVTRQTRCDGPCGFCAGVMDRMDPEALEGREAVSQGRERGVQA